MNPRPAQTASSVKERYYHHTSDLRHRDQRKNTKLACNVWKKRDEGQKSQTSNGRWRSSATVTHQGVANVMFVLNGKTFHHEK